MKKCNKCGKILPDTAKFCRNCGSAVTDPSDYTEVNEDGSEIKPETTESSAQKIKRCRKCGNIVSDTAKFCNVCGADMRDSANYTMVDETTENPVDVSENNTEESVQKQEAPVKETTEKVEVPVEKAELQKTVHQVKKCNHCGNIVPDTAKFCNVCGADMRDSANYTLVDEETGKRMNKSTAKPEEPEHVSEKIPVQTEETETAENTVEDSEPTSETAGVSDSDEKVSSENVTDETEETKPVHWGKKCNQCGNIVPDTAKFCNVCGADMRDSANYTMVDEETGKRMDEFTTETEESEPAPEETSDVTPATGETASSEESAQESTKPAVENTEAPAESSESAEDTSVENSETEIPVEETSDRTASGAQEDTVESEETKPEDSTEEERSETSAGDTSDESAEDTEEIHSEPVTTETTGAEDAAQEEPADTGENAESVTEPSEQPAEIPSQSEKSVHQVRKCNKCGNIVPDGAKFCNVCGTDMQNPANYSMAEEVPVHKVKKCNKCGNIVSDEAKFCNVCGADMSNPANYSMVEESTARKVKKCSKCGSIVPDGAKFCNVCGADMNDSANYTMIDPPKNVIDKEQVKKAVNEAGAVASATAKSAADAVNKAVKSDKVQNFLHNKKAVTGVIIGVIAVVVLMIVFAIKPKTINLADYTTITVTGYDGHGTAEVTVNEMKLESDIYAAARKKGTIQYINSVNFDPTYKLDKSENLSNGDKVTLTWDVDPKTLDTLKIRLKTKDIRKKVSGLKKVDTFDAFKGIKVKVKGAAPYGEAELNEDSKDGLVYKLNKSTGLSNGDKIKVTVSSSYDDDDNFTEYVQEYGKMPEKTTRIFEVSDLDTYVTDAGDLSDDVIKKMRSQAEDVISADDANNLSDDVHLDSLTYQGLYFLKAKDRKDDDGDDYYDDAYNKVYIVELQTFTAKDWDGNTYTEKAYTAVEFNSISKASGGTIKVDLSDYSEMDNGFYTGDEADVYLNGYETQDELYEDCVTTQADHYTSETKAAS